MEADPTALPRLDVLFEAPDVSGGPLPGRLGDAYGGDFGLAASLVYANFVASIDGVAAERTRPRSSTDISDSDPRDRFVMGLLRAAADAIVIGAGTLRAHAGGSWSPAHAFPAAAEDFHVLRAERQLAPSPRLAVLSATGNLPADSALDGAMLFTTKEGSRALRAQAVRADVFIVPGGIGGLDLRRVVEVLRAHGLHRILTEGGPRLMSSLVRACAVDELFLTVSPLLAGRAIGSDRPGIVDGVAFDPQDFRHARLLSLRRGGSLVFLRYAMNDRTIRRHR
jgi:riboflavin biosynthesis pyrimidine reductase